MLQFIFCARKNNVFCATVARSCSTYTPASLCFLFIILKPQQQRLLAFRIITQIVRGNVELLFYYVDMKKGERFEDYIIQRCSIQYYNNNSYKVIAKLYNIDNCRF